MRDCGLDAVNRDVDALIVRFRPLFHIELPVQYIRLGRPDKGRQLFNERLAFPCGDKSGGLDGIDKELDFGSFEVPGADEVLILLFALLHNVNAEVGQIGYVVANGARIFDGYMLALQVVLYLVNCCQMIFVRHFPKERKNMQNSAYASISSHFKNQSQNNITTRCRQTITLLLAHTVSITE